MKTHIATGILAAALTLCSCTKEKTETPFFRAEPKNGTATFEIGHQQTSLTDHNGLTVYVYSNQHWNIRTEVEEGADDSWYSIYPDSGDDDGRFYINVNELDNPYPRKFHLIFEDGNGNELYSADFTQNGTDPYIIPDQEMLSYNSSGGTLKINVSTNVVWSADIVPEKSGDDISWCTVSDMTETSMSIVAATNSGEEKRNAVLRISMTGRENVNVDIPVTQLPVYSVHNAELITVAEALTRSGIIEDNIKIQGYVTSDASTGNMTSATDMFVQDESGAGIIIELPDAADNAYPVGTALTFWLTGTAVKTCDDGMIRIGNITNANIFSETTLTGSGAVPVTVTDLSTLNEHPYTLVTLKDVHFTCPVGTLCNVGTWKSGAAKSALTPLMDRYGNTAFIRTLTSFTQKYDRNLTRNSCDITGIVLPDNGEKLFIDGNTNNVKVMDGFDFGCSLRLRYSSDVKDNGTAGSFTPIVYWLGINTLDTFWWQPAYGNGAFNLISGISGAKGPNNTARVSYAQIDVADGPADSNCYTGYSTVTNWDATYGGYYYELSTSTAGCSGKIAMSFLVGSFGSAARYYKLQYDLGDGSWQDVPDGNLEMWNSLTSGTASTSDYTHLYEAQPFTVVLPADAAGRDELKVRLTTKGRQNKRCDGSNKAASNASSFCLYYFAFSELK